MAMSAAATSAVSRVSSARRVEQARRVLAQVDDQVGLVPAPDSAADRVGDGEGDAVGAGRGLRVPGHNGDPHYLYLRPG